MKKHVKGFSPLYVGGEDWYTALSFVFDYGGSIAKRSHGKWVGTLDSKKSIAGLNRVQGLLQRHAAEVDGDARRAAIRTRTPSSRRAARPRTTGRPGTRCCTGKKYTKSPSSS